MTILISETLGHHIWFFFFFLLLLIRWQETVCCKCWIMIFCRLIYCDLYFSFFAKVVVIMITSRYAPKHISRHGCSQASYCCQPHHIMLSHICSFIIISVVCGCGIQVQKEGWVTNVHAVANGTLFLTPNKTHSTWSKWIIMMFWCKRLLF